jgi:hypothetical protein
MEIIGITTTIVFVSIVWFFIVLSVSKALNIKKDAPIGIIMCCLVIMGPIGWSIILVITAYDLVDRLFTSKK